jgi:cyclohexadieny/prephenate dehydrogenase
MLFDTLTVVGVGLIGGSVGQAARRRKVCRHVVGVGREASSLGRAQATGAIDSFTLDLTEGTRSADLVVFCTPVDRIAAQAKEAAAACRRGTILTDAGSTKATIVAELEGKLPGGIAFVGSHPLAGSEKRGPEHASADLFQGRVTVVTRTSRTDPEAFERVTSFWKALGSTVHVLNPESHDRALALTSHLPHLLASALAGLLPEAWRPFTATGFRDTTRIAAGDPGLWAAIFRENGPAVRDALTEFRGRLDAFEDALITGDAAALTELLSQAKRVRDDLGS